MSGEKDVVGLIAEVLIIVGGLNWLLVGLFSFNLVTAITFGISALSSAIYIVVGIAAIYQLVKLLK